MILCFIPVVISVYFEQSTYNVNEDDGVVQPVLVLSSPPVVNITVYVLSIDGSAVHETDYELETHEVTFHSGDNKTTLNIAITNDTVWEPNEDFILTINASSLPSNVNVSNTTVTILNDDGK